MRPPLFLVCIASIVSCESKSSGSNAEAVPTDTASMAVVPDTVYSAQWNMGRDPDEPFSSVDTRFVVRVAQFGSGTLKVWLDSSRAGASEKDRPFFPADSVQISGLTRLDRFTQGCGYGSGPWKPRIGVVSDTVYEHASRPKYIWFLDTTSVRIRQLPTDSATCFVAGPD
jgi:hypothetical protein